MLRSAFRFYGFSISSQPQQNISLSIKKITIHQTFKIGMETAARAKKAVPAGGGTSAVCLELALSRETIYSSFIADSVALH